MFDCQSKHVAKSLRLYTVFNLYAQARVDDAFYLKRPICHATLCIHLNVHTTLALFVLLSAVRTHASKAGKQGLKDEYHMTNMGKKCKRCLTHIMNARRCAACV